MPFRKGDSVRVKAGIKDPDNPEVEIGGWQGRVTDISHANDAEEPIIGLAWDSVTLKAMPEWLIVKSAKENLNWAEMYLRPDELEPAQPRDTPKDVATLEAQMSERYCWLDLGPEGERIQAIVNSAKSQSPREVLRAWRKSLGAVLQFPFLATVDEFQERGPLRGGDRVKVLGFADALDLTYGILVKCHKGQHTYDFPLADLAAVDERSVNAEPIQDYRVWHANR